MTASKLPGSGGSYTRAPDGALTLTQTPTADRADAVPATTPAPVKQSPVKPGKKEPSNAD